MSLNNDVKSLKQHRENVAKKVAAEKAAAKAKQEHAERVFFEKELKRLFHELFKKTQVTIDPVYKVASFIHDGTKYYLCYEHYYKHSNDPDWPDDDYYRWTLKKGSQWNDSCVVVSAWYTDKEDPYQLILAGIVDLK